MTRWKIFSEMLIETLATEESPGPSRHLFSDLTWNDKKDKPCLWIRKILRRPRASCKLIKDDVGLLRMTVYSLWSTLKGVKITEWVQKKRRAI
jgi:hypothetical protein